MSRPKSDPKADALREHGCLHPHPEQITDEVFLASAFFDRRDLVQVKYEMLRRVRGLADDLGALSRVYPARDGDDRRDRGGGRHRG